MGIILEIYKLQITKWVEVEDIRKELLGKRVKVISGGGESTVFKQVTRIIGATKALNIRPIRSEAKEELLYVVEGSFEKSSDRYINEATSNDTTIMVNIYPDSIVIIMI